MRVQAFLYLLFLLLFSFLYFSFLLLCFPSFIFIFLASSVFLLYFIFVYLCSSSKFRLNFCDVRFRRSLYALFAKGKAFSFYTQFAFFVSFDISNEFSSAPVIIYVYIQINSAYFSIKWIYFRNFGNSFGYFRNLTWFHFITFSWFDCRRRAHVKPNHFYIWAWHTYLMAHIKLIFFSHLTEIPEWQRDGCILLVYTYIAHDSNVHTRIECSSAFNGSNGRGWIHAQIV